MKYNLTKMTAKSKVNNHSILLRLPYQIKVNLNIIKALADNIKY